VNLTNIADELDALFERGDCLRSALCVYPCDVVQVANTQQLGWNGSHLPPFARIPYLSANGLRYVRRHNVGIDAAFQYIEELVFAIMHVSRRFVSWL
jgi:hypothetical protein